ncbi:MAG: response regulator transcription factor [Anaerolinea sp.]|nr:response regulator transcription factor [Anaerolinea sp.]
MDFATDVQVQQHKILVIDDNVYTLRLVQHALEQGNYQVVTATSGEKAFELIAQIGLPHLAIVDYHMPPGMSGFEFCRTIHQFCDLPIIMLTAVNSEESVIEGLEKYAEDYIVKPFNPGELAARVQRVLRRIGDFAYTLAAITQVDERLLVDFPKRQVIVNGEVVSLTPTETKLLYILMRSAGKTVTTDFILRRLWPLEPAYEDRLHVHMHRLRRKIEDKSLPPYIVSERGQGYTFQTIM